MPVVVSVVGAGIGALLVVLVAEWTGTRTVVGDPAPAERWFVDHVARFRAARRVVHALDRRVWGGAMVAFAFLAVSGAAALVGWIFATVDDDRGFARFDQALTEWGHEHATEASTDLLAVMTRLGDTFLMVAVMSAVGLLVVWRRPGRPWAVLGFLLTVVVGVSLINNILKWIVMRDRPQIGQLVGSGGSSFPSGHSATAAACWAALALVVSAGMGLGHRRWSAAAAVMFAVLVAASRVMLGVHWLTDVIAGVIVGWTWFFVVALVFGGRLQRFGEPAERIPPERPTDRKVEEPVSGALS